MNVEANLTNENPFEQKLNGALSHRDKVSRLSRSGLVAMLVAMFTIPVATVLTLWFYMPPVSLYELEAEVKLENLETAAEFDRRNLNMAIKEPRILVKNVGLDEWTHIIVEINKRYKIYRSEKSIQPGETLSSGLDYFQTREGIFFPPGKIDVKHVRVYARIPTGARATYEVEYSPKK